MKKIVAILLLLAMFISFVQFTSAEDSVKVTQGVIERQEDELTMEVVMPIFEGFKGADKVNEKVMNIYLNAIGQANASARSLKDFKEEMKASDEPPFSPIASLDMNYGYAVIGNILSVQLNIYSYAGGAHGMSQVINITSNTESGEIYTLKDLFREGVDYKTKIRDFILSEIEREDELYFPDYRETIENRNGDYEFFIDGDKVVVYFGLYDIAPYSSGIRFFTIDPDDIKDLLKEDVYDSIKGEALANNAGLNKKDGQDNHIFDLMKAVESPMTADQAVSFYAEAVKLRNGVAQYSLMDDQLREENYNVFKEMNFVTGTSSPWVDSYELIQLEENLYQVKFTLKTSLPSDSLTRIVKLKLVEDSQHIKITSIEELN